MKVGIRKPSIKKSISARSPVTKVKKATSIKKYTNPVGTAKKRVYNKVYNKTTVSITSVGGSKKRSSSKKKSSNYSSYRNNGKPYTGISYDYQNSDYILNQCASASNKKEEYPIFCNVKLINDKENIKYCKVGYSWTNLILMCWLPLMRLDLKNFLIQIISIIILSQIALPLWFACWIGFPFIYNKMYIKDLIKKGYIPFDKSTMDILNKNGFNLKLYYEEEILEIEDVEDEYYRYDDLNNSQLIEIEKEDVAINPEYEILEEYSLNKYSKVYSLEYSQKFNDIDIKGYKILQKNVNVVGGWYRKENINEFANSIKNIEEPEIDIVLEKEPDNQYDTNAIKVDAIYKVNNEIRKIQIGYLSREDAYELKDIDDLKASIVNLDRLEYNDITINIWINESKYTKIIEDRQMKLKQREEYDKELEKIQKKSKIAYEYNQLAMQLEKDRDIDGAIEHYEKCIELKFEGNYPYDRLAILYRKIRDYDNEIRVLNQAIELFEFLEKATLRMDVSPKLEKFKTRLNRANELRNKKNK